MYRKFINVTKICLVIVFSATLLASAKEKSAEDKSEEGKIGGNLKFFLFDKTKGTSNGVENDQKALTGFVSCYVFISRQINEYLSVDVEPSLSTSTGATPKLGKLISSQLTASPSVSISFIRALLTTKLPENIELSAGVLHPLFTEDYGAQIWYEEEFYGNYASSNAYLGEMKDVGIELYKNFEVGPVSIPAYLYLTSGAASSYTDNNNSKGIMLHIAPEIGAFKFMGSYFMSNWDENDAKYVKRWSAGLGFTEGNFMFRSEYMAGVWQDKDVYTNTLLTSLTKTTQNFTPQGYYAKVGYRFFPWMRLLVSLAQYNQNFSKADKKIGTTTASYDTSVGEIYTRLSPIVNLYVSPESIIYLQYDITSNSLLDDSAKLKYNRFVVGWRTTF